MTTTGTSRPDGGPKVLTESTIIGYLGSRAFTEDPFPAYRFFLDHPGWPSPSGYRVFARFGDVLGILRDPDAFGQPGRADGNFHTVDPPEHTRLRKLVSRAFTFRAMSQQRQFIESVADELLDEIRPAGRMDLATDFSALLPGRVTAKLLGADYEDGARWQFWLDAIKASRGIVHYLAPDPAEKQRAEAAAAEAAKDTAAFLAELIRRRKDHDGDDIVSVLLRAQDGDDSLSDKEVLCTLLLLLGAGLHTTTAQIATTMRLLLERPATFARVAADTGLIANAVEEALRYEGALQAEYRLVKRPAEVGGVRLGQGELLLIVNGAANRDPLAFESPDVFDIDRPNAKDHLAFGRGIHRCLGAELAREELNIAVARLIGTLPGLHETREPVRHRYNRWPGLATMPVHGRQQVSEGAETRFDGRVAVVTGAGRGLGREFAKLLASRGAAVVVNDIGTPVDADRYTDRDRDVAYRVAEGIAAGGGKAVGNGADVADPAGAASVVADAVAAFGRVDIVINNAGIVVDGALADATPEALRAAWGVHVGGAFNILSAAWPHLAAQGYGRIVNVGSIAGLLVGVAGHTPYEVAKGGLAGLTRALATEGEPLGITVNALLPTADTRSAASVPREYERGARFEARHVAPVAAWLAHEDCRVHGRFFAAGAGRVGEVFTSAAAGYQCARPAEFSLEHIRANWEVVKSPAAAVTPASIGDYNTFRMAIYEAAVS